MEWRERSRKMHANALTAISRAGQVNISNALDISEATISRMKNDEMPRVIDMLAAAGLKIVEVDRICVKKEEWLLVTKIAARALMNEQMAAQLTWEDSE